VFTLLNQELLFLAFRQLKRDKAPGVDGVTVDDYAVKLQANLRDLENRLHAGSYRPQPSNSRRGRFGSLLSVGEGSFANSSS